MTMLTVIVTLFLALAVSFLVVAVTIIRGLKAKAVAAGYSGVHEYLRAAPRNDEEKLEAVDMALKGAVLFIAGLIFPPLILFGLFPFYYGTRKLCLTSFGLGPMENGE